MDNIINFSKLLSDSSRVMILTALMSDKALTPGELAIIANITPQTVSSHLSKLVNGGLITYIAACRHKYYYLKSDKVANLLETMYELAPLEPFPVPKHNRIHPHLKFARTCYNHLAGNLAVSITSNLIKKGYIIFDGTFNISATGEQFFKRWGINLNQNTHSPLIKPCMDWTERKFHIGGTIGKEILAVFMKNDWLRRGNIHRTVYLTESGRRQLSDVNLI